MSDKHILKGSLQAIILQLLTEQDRMYGYEITQKVKQLTANELHLTEGALYPALHKLESEGFLEAEVEVVENRVRKYYKLTSEGKTEAANKALALLESFRQITQLLQIKPL
ncbi:helix-turn-helix transcriptional regulator [Cytophagales bacterium LB-30]|uniref:Helix-turn-helix transcriptional regulator n=1 Tax=Shiella aurantiaca TaxID=3058365 RepID=A0ABT8F1M0_9BACT|nr:helix-turn-helix transcriptional regulator [Shiella aurantiaca]MDN4164327.1 helix-turn-helix transcriptional regulator [Shiella aurantiaca]